MRARENDGRSPISIFVFLLPFFFLFLIELKIIRFTGHRLENETSTAAVFFIVFFFSTVIVATQFFNQFNFISSLRATHFPSFMHYTFLKKNNFKMNNTHWQLQLPVYYVSYRLADTRRNRSLLYSLLLSAFTADDLNRKVNLSTYTYSHLFLYYC